MLNEFLWSQLSGPLVQSLINAIENCDHDIDPILDYFYELTIDTASDEELIIIGLLIGVPWPTAPAGTFDDTVLILGPAGSLGVVIDRFRGLGDRGTGLGGIFQGSSAVSSQIMPVAKYRLLLKAIARMKLKGLSFTVMDEIVSIFSSSYVYLWDLSGATDIHIKVSSLDVSAGGMFILQKIFDRFSTDPYIEISRGTI
jgi:hypothetical protein